MKKVLWIFASALLLSNLFVSTGCGDDENGTGIDLAPILIIKNGPSAETVVGQDAVVTITVEATKGTAALKTLTVIEGGTNVSLTRLTINGSPAAANPVLIVTPSDVMTWEVGINVQDAFDKRGYTIRVADDKGLTDEITFDITVEEGIEKTITGVLWNQAGPAGRGALDLDAGLTTGITSVGETTPDQAEIRDCGIDSTNTVAQFWRKQITHVNGTEMRFLGSALSDFNFNTVASKEAIARAFDVASPLNGTPITQNGTPTWGSYKVSEVVKEGDLFVVRKPTRTYLIKIDKITETTGNNNDNYEISIKY